MDFKLLGSVLLIVGTTIGAGILALPIATAKVGFLGSVFLLVVCWFIMTTGALLLLEVNLWLPQNNNLITMAGATIGPLGQIVSWITYLLLLYSLLCAYMASGSDLFHLVLASGGINIPLGIALLLFILIFGSVVYFGIRSVDYVNRLLMLVKFSAFFLLIFLLLPYLRGSNLMTGNFRQIGYDSAIMVTISAFGYSTIIPSLRIYFAGDIKRLKRAIFIGSLIPLLCYILWDAAIMGVIPLYGDNGLISILQAHRSTSDFVETIGQTTNNASVNLISQIFTSICVLTSFLGVALCLSDFWADGLRMEKKGVNRFIIHLIIFFPPFLIVLFFPSIFIKALEYAGVYSLILLVVLPAWMAWTGRYKKKFRNDFKVFGGRWLLSALILFALGLILLNFADEFNSLLKIV